MLPYASTSNIGNVLGVSNGGYALIDPDESVFAVLHGAVDLHSGLNMTLTESANDIVAAAASEKPVLLKWTLTDMDDTVIPEYTVCDIALADSESGVAFIRAHVITEISNGLCRIMEIEIQASSGAKTVTIIPITLYALPNFDSGDAGSVLAVDANGALEWKTLN